MKTSVSMKILAACVVTASVILGVAYVKAAPDTSVTASHLNYAQNPFPQPDTKSPDWRPLSDDLGIWIAKTEYVGVRGRLYVRLDDSWWPVAVDGMADIRGVLPVR